MSGPDFVSDARLAPDGVTLSLAPVGPPGHAVGRRPAGGPRRRRHRARVAGGPGESVVQPVWGDGPLAVVLQRPDRLLVAVPKRPHEEPSSSSTSGSDIAGPQWVFGQSRFALLADGRVAFAYGRDGSTGSPCSSRRERPRARRAVRRFRCLTAQGTAVVCVAAGPSSEPVVLRVDVDGGEPENLRPARDLGLHAAWFSRPEHVSFPTEDRGTGIGVAHALVYPPTNPEAAVPTATCRR